jgi:hypothetical protein
MNFEEFLDSIKQNTGKYLSCEYGHQALPPRRACPECGATELSVETLPETGRLIALTEIHVPTAEFSDEVPYCTAIARFGPLRLTGQLRGATYDDVSVGNPVVADVRDSSTTGNRVVVFSPA